MLPTLAAQWANGRQTTGSRRHDSLELHLEPRRTSQSNYELVYKKPETLPVEMLYF